MKRILPVGVALLFAAVQLAPGALVWRKGEGWVNEDAQGNVIGQADNSKEQLEVGRAFERKGDYKGARSAYQVLVRKWPFSFNAGEAQFKMGWCNEKLADFRSAFDAYQRCVEKYPASNFFEQALERQYAIANLFLSGEPQRLWKVPVPTTVERVVAMYEQIVKNAPYGKLAPVCTYKTGLANESFQRWSEAIKCYEKVLEQYPNDDIVDDALYQIGYAWMQAARINGFDEGASAKAIDAFTEFVARYPKSEKVGQAKKNLEELRGRGTEGVLNIARFYEGQKRIDAAILSYMEVVQVSPNSAEGQLAKRKVEQLSRLRPPGAKPLLLSSQMPRQSASDFASGPGDYGRGIPSAVRQQAEPALPQSGGAADAMDPFAVPPMNIDTNAPPSVLSPDPAMPGNSEALPNSPDLSVPPTDATPTAPSAKPLEQ
jgi:outer membrane protein assembly factor BamD